MTTTADDKVRHWNSRMADTVPRNVAPRGHRAGFVRLWPDASAVAQTAAPPPGLSPPLSNARM